MRSADDIAREVIDDVEEEAPWSVRVVIKRAQKEAYAEGNRKQLKQLKTLIANHKYRLADGLDELESLRGLHNAIEFILQQKP